jgi:hypothetical protein
MLPDLLNRASRLTWFHVTRFIAIALLIYAFGFEENAGNRGTMVMAAVGLLGAEPVARRDQHPPRPPAPAEKEE